VQVATVVAPPSHIVDPSAVMSDAEPLLAPQEQVHKPPVAGNAVATTPT
jgi:hypothetical protein